ncbi:hypothetical protein PCASD_01453 [Puccinia coronata f. sp. avenae]|uniref:Uncharacterized protein n=1 Tax=Puccinia coronata f. sp. avenae TaxID=200324 RepID=A0A2N5VKJ4_9BASI|nr:hypothetical protein PCASD_01453 [Puccinia coronata f. sp. avenae]
MMLTSGFCMGFRYDLAVRANAFQCNNFHDGKLVFPDISKLHKDMENQATNDAKAFNKIGLQENPYIAGGKRSDIDPWTGQPKATNNRRNNNNNHNNGNNGNNHNSNNPNNNNNKKNRDRGCQQHGFQENNRQYKPYPSSSERQQSSDYDDCAREQSKGFQNQDKGYQNSGASKNRAPNSNKTRKTT